MVNMDEKSGNNGDKLKQYVMLEIINKCVLNWDQINYAESHAGAGVYHSSRQIDHQYIENIYHQITGEYRKINHYTNVLENWWKDPYNVQGANILYPGTINQVYRLLKSKTEEFTIKGVEEDSDTFLRLKGVFNDPRVEVKEGDFAKELNFLFSQNNLVALMDPFAIVPSVPQKKGHLSAVDINSIINNYFVNKDAILLLWTSYAHALVANRSQNEDILPPYDRLYATNTSHYVYVYGFGSGKNIVNSLSDKVLMKDII